MQYCFMQKQTDLKKQSDETRSIRLNSAGWYLKILGTWMDKNLTEELKSLGFSLNHFAIIMTLLEQDGLTQSEIGERVLLPGYATTRNIDKLESMGYLKRKKHESSRRSFRILLTVEGRALAPNLHQATKNVNELFLSYIEKEKKDEFLNILAGVVNNLAPTSKDNLPR
jgi:DNA-binding MarR family transcriptional regulator